MRITGSIYALPIRRQLGPVERTFHLTVLLDKHDGPALIDTGLPGSEDVIAEALSDGGIRPADLWRVVITQHHLNPQRCSA